MSNPPEKFDPAKFVRGLPEENLEFLSEFAEEAQVNLRALARSSKFHEEPTATQFLKIFTSAPAELETKKKKRALAHRNTRHEWGQELGLEVSAKEKEGTRLPVVLTHEEVDAMLKLSKKKSKRNHLIFRLLYSGGFRRSELTKMVVADIDFTEGKIFVRAGKGDKDRYVLIDSETSSLLAAYTQGFPIGVRVFDISDRTVNRAVKGIADDLGISDRYKAMGRRFTAHSLRHTYATHLYEAGMDSFELKELLGHTFVSTTLGYVHTSLDRIRDSYDAHHPLNQRST